MNTTNDIKKQKEFLIKRIKNSTSTESLLERIKGCQETYERHCVFSSTTTSVDRLYNILKYEMLQSILEERLETEKKYAVQFLEGKVKSLQEELDSIKQMLDI